MRYVSLYNVAAVDRQQYHAMKLTSPDEKREVEVACSATLC